MSAPPATADYDKQQTVLQWDNDPCGASGGGTHEPGTQAFFDAIDHNRYVDYAPWMPETLEFAQHAGERVLEVGFGLGTDLMQFAKNGAHVTGIDLVPRHHGLATRRFELAGIPADLQLGDAERLPFKSESFDLVYTFGVIHHTPDTQKCINEIRRVLRPGGKAIIGVYHAWSAFLLFGVLFTRHLALGGFLRRGWRQTFSTIEYRKNSDACPLVKAYGRARFRNMLAAFSDVSIKCKHLEPSHFGLLAGFVSDAASMTLEQRLGWYLVAKARKGSRDQ